MAVALTGATALAQTSQHDYTVNPGAEGNDTSGWTVSGWSTRAYDSFRSVRVPDNNAENKYLFVGTTTAGAMTQVASVAALATEIDDGQDPFFIAALLGGSGTSAVDPTVVAQPLDGTGVQLGQPTQIGPPTASDRRDETAVLRCFLRVQMPAGTRQVRVTVTAGSAASGENPSLADQITLSDAVPVFPLKQPTPAEGAGCYHNDGPFASTVGYAPDPQPTPTPTPTPSPTVYATPASVSLKVPSQSRARVKRRGHLRIRCSMSIGGRCAVTARRGDRAVARGSRTFATGASLRVIAKLTRHGRSVVRRAASVHLRVTGTATFATGDRRRPKVVRTTLR